MHALPGLSRETSLLLWTLAAVVGLIVLVARCKVPSFLALIVASLFVGLGVGFAPLAIVRAFQDGLGSVLGDIAMVIALGAVLGKLLAESGGAEQIAATLTRAFGERRLPWTMMVVAFVVGLPVFFAVGLVLLAPILYAVARETRSSLLRLGLPLVAGLSAAHGLVPPHPGPMAAIGLLNNVAGGVDVGRVILYAVILGFAAAVIAGPVLAPILARAGAEPAPVDAAPEVERTPRRVNLPGFGITLFTVLLPIVLMLAASAADVTLPKENTVRRGLDFLGSPLVAMLVATLVAFGTFGLARGFTGTQLLQFSNDCLGPVAGILLVVGAGSGFNGVLKATGVGAAVAGLVQGWPVSVLVLGWLVAALIRVATGSATVAITMAAGLVADIAARAPGTNFELLVIAMGAGSLILSHVNDGGFWFVKEYLRLSVPQTLRTWTVIETVLSVVVLLMVLLLDRFL